MQERALAVPFESAEIKSIILDELKKRMDNLSPMYEGKEFASFDASFQVTIKLRRAGETVEGKDTLAWGSVKGGDPAAADLDAVAEEVSIVDEFESKGPNVEREQRNMPMTVESGDGRGGKIRKKVRVKG